MTKIALCTEVLYPLYGVERRVYEMAKRLPKYGYEVDLYSSTANGSLDIDIIQVSKPTITKQPKRNYLHCLQYSRNLIKELGKSDCNIIDANGHLSLLPCSIAGLKTHKPVVATIHDLYLLEWHYMYKGFGAFVGLPFEIFISQLPYRKVITLNSSLVKRMKESLKMRSPIEVIPSGIDVKYIDKIKSEKLDNRVVYIGRLVPQKNVDMLIRAFSEIDGSYELIIVGEGSEKERLVDLSKKLGVKNVKFLHSFKNHEDAIKMIKSSTVLAMPSKRECFGIIPLEAMCSYTAVVSTRTEGPSDYIENGKNGFLVDIGDSKDMGEKIKLLLEDSILRRKIAHNARKTAEGYDWENIVKRIASVYDELA
jgi:glycosyltransferase involved in cell wall biosynthesis